MSVDKLKSDGIIIRDETKEGANTAQRVGSWMVNASEEIGKRATVEQVNDAFETKSDEIDRAFKDQKKEVDEALGKIKEPYKTITEDDIDNLENGMYKVIPTKGEYIIEQKIGYYYDDSGNLIKNIDDSAIAIRYKLYGAKSATAILYGSSIQTSYHLIDKDGRRKSVSFGAGLHSLTIDCEGYEYLDVTNYTTRDFAIKINYVDKPTDKEQDIYWILQETDRNNNILQVKWNATFEERYKRIKKTIWSNWEKTSSSSITIEGSTDFISPNDIKEGSQIERINKAIELAASSGLRAVIPQKDTITDTNVWLIDSCILLISNTTLEMLNCKIKLSDKCRDNFMRTANLMPNQNTIETYYDIHVKGIGRVIFEGADNPRSTGDWNKKLSLNSSGWESYGTDANKPGENQYGGWLNHGINIVETERFSVQNIRLMHYHGHGFVMDRARFGYVNGISFYATGELINGKRATNQDGFGVRQGCRNITIENCTGTTGDDFMNIGCLLYESGTSDHITGNQNTHNPSGDIYRGEIDDTFNIIVQDIKGVECRNGTRVLRLMCSNKQNQYNITVQNIKCDIAGYISFTKYQVTAGNNYLYYFNDISNNIYFEAESGVTVKNSTFNNIAYTGNKAVVSNIPESNGNVFSNVRKI